MSADDSPDAAFRSSDDAAGRDAPPAPRAPPRPEVPEDVADGLRFVHAMALQTQSRVSELSATVYALVEALIAGGTLPLQDYEKRRRLTVLREEEEQRGAPTVNLTTVPDKYALTDLPDVDCASLLPLCKARCCTLGFALSPQDLDERVVRWDYARPYEIARGPTGYCVHNEGGRCTVYEQRPGVCRQYDCRQDTRIWVDFDKRIPAS